ncbi:MAG: non-ribosomal peptide synthetase, partial [Pseudomonas sp.]
DDCGRLLPRGMAGELCLAGPQIAEGYWKRPDLTAKAFVDCPWLSGEKMYRTGDLARYNENDELEYLGRIDNQVKLRGFRIELGEIESRASQYEGIKAVTAQVRRDTLVLYYTAEREINTDGLKAFLAETLTEYMVPEIYMHLENMPMTPNGKINLKALPDPDISDRQA